MIKRIICKLYGHIPKELDYRMEEIDEKITVVIPSKTTCERCSKIIQRPIHDFEIPFIISGKVKYD